MKVLDTSIQGCFIIQPRVFEDSRGFFLETYQEERYAKMLNTELPFVQDNHSRSQVGVLRGLHFQKTQSARDKNAKKMEKMMKKMALSGEPKTSR